MKLLLIGFIVLLTHQTEVPTQFSEAALKDNFMTLDGDLIPFKEILKQEEGKEVVIDIWASWCTDCIAGMPKVKHLQKQYPDVVFVFLSLDKEEEKWKIGIDKFNLKGEHYFMQSGWKGEFGTFVKLDWIPRYMVIDKKGNIELFKAIMADDKEIKKALK